MDDVSRAMSDFPGDFDDPSLKAAVQRAAGRETAPRHLRERVSALLAQSAAASDATAASDAAPVRRQRFMPDRAGWRTLSAAACVLLAFGWMALQIRNEFFPTQVPPQVGRTTLHKSLVVNLIRAHDNCAKLPDHHLIAGDTPEQLHDKLTAQEGVNVSTANLGDGWQFKGAGLCQVGDRRAAHLFYVRGDDAASVFSMPAPEGCGSGGLSHKEVVEKHSVAGFRQGEAFYSVVASSKSREFTVAELEPLLAKVQASVSATANCANLPFEYARGHTTTP
jgi:hypothetical protein